jgi:glycosyltransferase involved in cell wall biosynthesis
MLDQKKLAVLIQEFNQPETILVISKYPHRKIGESFHGVAVYTRDTLRTISQATKQKFVVLVEKKYGRQAELQAGGSILVLPCFNTDPLGVFPQLLTALQQFKRAKNIQLHSEFYNSGNLVQMTALLPFLYLLRLQGKIVSFVAHNVVHDFAFLTNHFGQRETDWRFNLLSRLVPWYYRLLSLGVEQFITLDESIRARLREYLWQKNKVKATSIWLKNKTVSKAMRLTARQQLGYQKQDLVMTVFGFMSRYKGVDLLLKHFLRFKQEFPESRLKLLLAGGMAPSRASEVQYLRFYRQVERLAKQHQDITLTGFIPEPELGQYLAATDLVLLPYRGILGASASWATVLSYGKPCFFSEALAPYLAAEDVRAAFKETKVTKQDLLFSLDYAALRQFFLDLEKDGTKAAKALSFSQALRKLRDEKVCVWRDFPPLYLPRTSPQIVQACYNLADEKVAA